MSAEILLIVEPYINDINLKYIMNPKAKILIGVLAIGLLIMGGYIWKQQADWQENEDRYGSSIPEGPASIVFKLQVIEAIDNSSEYLEGQNLVVGLNYYTSPPPENFGLLMANLTEGKILVIRAVSRETYEPIVLRAKFISISQEKEEYYITIGNSPQYEWEKNIRIE